MHKIKRVHIETSTLCNSACITCPHDRITRAKLIDMDVARRIIQEDCRVYQDSIEFFEFHNYNEPFLRFDLFYQLATMVQSIYGDHRIGVVTNGSIMTEAIATVLLELKLSHIYFSIDGFSKQVFESQRVGLKFEEVYRNVNYFIGRCELLKYLTGEAVWPRISFVITEQNRQEKSQFEKYFLGRQCHPIFQDCDGRGAAVGKQAAVKDIWSEQPCDYALDGIYVLTNLDMVPCCLDWSGMAAMGNLANQTVQEIVDGERYQEFRDKQLTRRKREIALCRECKSNMIYGYPRS